MKKIILFLFLFIPSFSTFFCHTLESQKIIMREWHLKNHSLISGVFLFSKGDSVTLETQNEKIVKIHIACFSIQDQAYIKERNHRVIQLNTPITSQNSRQEKISQANPFLGVVLFFLLSVIFFFLFRRMKYKMGSYFLFLVVFGLFSAFRYMPQKFLSVATNPLTIDSAFVPFKPNVNTFWDNNYFYVESKGIPTTHTMMVGISNHGWQQQVPIPQCYFGSNAWPIPLNPTMASNPIPVDSIHFTRGAIALAVNGVPIFNVHTNTGVDSYLDGQLDDFGGHCGRADDYHYHIAPLHLYGTSPSILPVAYGLDGFAVYGALEPDGTAMQTLDANHGHFGSNGVYHYHGTSTAPYMIAKMAGLVTEDATHQLIPQAQSTPVRPGNLTPLNGALITSCTPNSTGAGYDLSYSLNNVPGYATNYTWNTSGLYSFSYLSPTGTTTTNYNGFVQCDFPSGIQNEKFISLINLYPNPVQNELFLDLPKEIDLTSISEISIYNVEGKIIWINSRFQNTINLSSFSKGIYFVVIKTAKNNYVKKISKE